MSDDPSPCGGRTVRIWRDAGPWRWGQGQLTQKISALAWQGQRVRFTAAVRTMAKGVGAGALLFVRFLPRSDADFLASHLGLTTAVSADQPMRSPDWSTCTVEANVPDAADCLVLGLVMTGDGAAWFGELELVLG